MPVLNSILANLGVGRGKGVVTGALSTLEGDIAKNVRRAARSTLSKNAGKEADLGLSLRGEADKDVAGEIALGGLQKKNFVTKAMANENGFWGGDTDAVHGMMGAIRAHQLEGQGLGAEAKSLRSSLKRMKERGYHEEGHAKNKLYQDAEQRLANISSYQNSIGRHFDSAMNIGGHFMGYMNSGSAGQIAAKYGTLAAGYVGAAGLVRGVTTGGSMFYDGDGRADIAGIPFI